MNKPKQSAFGPAPRVASRPEELRHLDDLRIDPYYYLRDKELPELQDYLRAENAYTEQVMASTKELQEEIYQEIVGRIKETDQSYPAEAITTIPAQSKAGSTPAITATRSRPSRSAGAIVPRRWRVAS